MNSKKYNYEELESSVVYQLKNSNIAMYNVREDINLKHFSPLSP